MWWCGNSEGLNFHQIARNKVGIVCFCTPWILYVCVLLADLIKLSGSLCINNTSVNVRLGLGTKNTWLWFGKDHVLVAQFQLETQLCLSKKQLLLMATESCRGPFWKPTLAHAHKAQFQNWPITCHHRGGVLHDTWCSACAPADINVLRGREAAVGYFFEQIKALVAASSCQPQSSSHTKQW